jgi:hypothetical protein
MTAWPIEDQIAFECACLTVDRERRFVLDTYARALAQLVAASQPPIPQKVRQVGRPKDPHLAQIKTHIRAQRRANKSWKEIRVSVQDAFGRQYAVGTLKRYAKKDRDGGPSRG